MHSPASTEVTGFMQSTASHVELSGLAFTAEYFSGYGECSPGSVLLRWRMLIPELRRLR